MIPDLFVASINRFQRTDTLAIQSSIRVDTEESCSPKPEYTTQIWKRF